MNTRRAPYPTPTRITFDGYVIPGSVRDVTPPRPATRVNGVLIGVGAIAVLTFMLGSLATWRLTSGTVDVAHVPEQMQGVVAADTVAQDVTRQRAPDLLTTGNADAQPETPTLETGVPHELMPNQSADTLSETERTQKARTALAIVSPDKLRVLREGVLAGRYTVAPHAENGHRRTVLQTVDADPARQSMGDLLREAAREGRIEVPASVRTAGGDVDVNTLMFSMVQASLAEDGSAAGAEAAREMSRRAFAASDATTFRVQGERVYVVAPGDSLAYISLQFYGRPSAYTRIFQANRSVLTSPERIQIGQRLIIPG